MLPKLAKKSSTIFNHEAANDAQANSTTRALFDWIHLDRVTRLLAVSRTGADLG